MALLAIWVCGLDAMKTLSTADGGMMYIRDLDLRVAAEEQLYLGLPVKQKSGIDSSTEGNASWWEFEMNRPGRRAVMNNVTGAIGCVQLKKLSSFISRREVIYSKYENELNKLDWITVPSKAEFENVSSYYFFWIQTEYRDELAKYLLDNGVYTTFRYWPLHKVELFKEYGLNNSYPNTDYIATHTLNLPLHQSLSNEDVSRIIKLITDFKVN